MIVFEMLIGAAHTTEVPADASAAQREREVLFLMGFEVELGDGGLRIAPSKALTQRFIENHEGTHLLATAAAHGAKLLAASGFVPVPPME